MTPPSGSRPASRSPRVFISYRREDTLAITGRIYDKLIERLGRDNVFMDFDTIPLGADFREHLEASLERCDILLVIIGPNWLSGGRESDVSRLLNPSDFVRLEIQAALRQKITLIPVLVGGATMPSSSALPAEMEPLIYRQATWVDMARDFHVHMGRLIDAIVELGLRKKTVPARNLAESAKDPVASLVTDTGSARPWKSPRGRYVGLGVAVLGGLSAIAVLVFANAPDGRRAGVASTVGNGTITGTVSFTGTPPINPTIDMSAEPACERKHVGVPRDPEVLVTDGKLANVFVYVKSGLPEGQTYPPSTAAAVLDQDGCLYEPRNIGVMVGQPLEIRNSDDVLHNVKAVPTRSRGFNISQPTRGMTSTRTFGTEEVGVPLECSVHQWMRTSVNVLDHPFFASTGRDGAFMIQGLPAGTYELEASHERLGTQVQTVTVGADGRATAAFSFGTPDNPVVRTPAKTVTVNMLGDEKGYRFEPDEFTIARGDVVRFVNVSGPPHNVAFDPTNTPASARAALSAAMTDRLSELSGPFLLSPSESYSISFANVPEGMYRFTCEPHLAMNMKGVITVR